MKYRIAIWAAAGFLAAGFWALYLFAKAPMLVNVSEPATWILIRLTCPVVFASTYFHFALGLYWCLLANALTYGLMGLMVETLRYSFVNRHHSRMFV